MLNYSCIEPAFINNFIYIHKILKSANLFNIEEMHLYSLKDFPELSEN